MSGGHGHGAEYRLQWPAIRGEEPVADSGCVTGQGRNRVDETVGCHNQDARHGIGREVASDRICRDGNPEESNSVPHARQRGQESGGFYQDAINGRRSRIQEFTGRRNWKVVGGVQDHE